MAHVVFHFTQLKNISIDAESTAERKLWDCSLTYFHYLALTESGARIICNMCHVHISRACCSIFGRGRLLHWNICSFTLFPWWQSKWLFTNSLNVKGHEVRHKSSQITAVSMGRLLLWANHSMFGVWPVALFQTFESYMWLQTLFLWLHLGVWGKSFIYLLWPTDLLYVYKQEIENPAWF